MRLSKALIEYFKKFYAFSQKPLVKVVIIIIIIIFSSVYLITQYNELIDSVENITINIPLILLALVLVILTVFLGTLTWWSILSWLNYRPRWIISANGYAYSSLAKYVPGFVWQFASRAYFSDKLAIPIKFIGIGIIVEPLLSAIIGGLLACISYTLIGHQFFNEFPLLTVLVPIIAVLLVILLIKLPNLLEKLIQKYTSEALSFNKKRLYMSILFNSMGWILMSCAYWLIISSLGQTDFSFLSAVFFHTTSFVAGMIALPFPNGLIIREAILIYLGKSFFSEHLMVISSLIFRILILIAEAITTFILFIISRVHKKANNIHSENIY